MGIKKTLLKVGLRHLVVGVLTAGHGNVLLAAMDYQDAQDCWDTADAYASYGDYNDAADYYSYGNDYYNASQAAYYGGYGGSSSHYSDYARVGSYFAVLLTGVRGATTRPNMLAGDIDARSYAG